MAYTGAYVFGDSLVDAGNALKLAQWYGGLPFTDLPDGAPTASLGYFQGRFTDGYNFADLISNKTIGIVSKPIFPFHFEDPWLGIPIAPFAGDPKGNNLNFAYGGAQIIQGDEVVPDLDGQTDAFRDAIDGDAPPGALYMITIGGNDVRSLAPVGSDPVSVAEAHLALDAAADKLLHELSQLVDIGAHNFLITGVPDVGVIPKYDVNGNNVLDGSELLRSAAATEYSQYLDALIRTEVVPALQAMGANVTYVPVTDYVDANGNLVTGALNAILPTIAALHGLTADELSDNLLLYQNLVFFDDVHPNAQAHALVSSFMYAQLTGTPWVETLPLMGSDVDYRMTATIGTAGEVDSTSIYLLAGTTYTFEMLGISSLGTPGSLGDPTIRLLTPGGILAASDDDSGAGLDATLTFTPAAGGIFTLQLSAVGTLTGAYAMQAAVVSGAAMQAGNTYTVRSPSTLVIEGHGGIGVDTIKASVSYALAAGSEIEVLRTNSDTGKTAINLTGNELDQTIIGNNGANILEGKAGADVMTGGRGDDTFVLSNAAVTDPGAANIDKITDYRSGDIVDVTQILSVAVGTDVIGGGYLRVTTSGLIQVDVNGGGNEWVTLSTVNGVGAVTVRYLSGGVAANVSVARVSDPFATTAANSGGILSGAVAAAGLMAEPLAAEPHEASSGDLSAQVTAGNIGSILVASAVEPVSHSHFAFRSDTAETGSRGRAVPDNGRAPAANDSATSGHEAAVVSKVPLTELLQGTDAADHADTSAIAAPSITIPDAALLQGLQRSAHDSNMGESKTTGEVGRVLADALHGGGHEQGVDALLDAISAKGPIAALQSLADHGFEPAAAPFAGAHHAIAAEIFALHPDAAAAA